MIGETEQVTVIADQHPLSLENATVVATTLRRAGVVTETLRSGKIKNQIRRARGYFVVICEDGETSVRCPRTKLSQRGSIDEITSALINYFDESPSASNEEDILDKIIENAHGLPVINPPEETIPESAAVNDEDLIKYRKDVLNGFADSLLWGVVAWASFASNAIYVAGIASGLMIPHLAKLAKALAFIYAHKRNNR